MGKVNGRILSEPIFVPCANASSRHLSLSVLLCAISPNAEATALTARLAARPGRRAWQFYSDGGRYGAAVTRVLRSRLDAALELAGNPKSRVELFAEADHGIIMSKSGCPKDQLAQLEQYVKSLGFTSLQAAQEAFLANPDDPQLLEAYPYAPGYLDLIEEWLRGLKQ